MSQTTKIIEFPKKAMAKKRPRIKNIDGMKYFNTKQIKLLRRTVRDQAATGRITNIREWMAIDLLTSTGVRVSEAANVRCGDLKISYGDSRLFVRNGKGYLSAHLEITESLKKHLKHYLQLKSQRGEPTGKDDYLFIGQRGPWTSQALQQIVKKYLRQLNLYERGKSVHSLRHSYGVELYARDRDLRCVQKQLRHVSTQSTIIYADVTQEDVRDQIKGLWN